MAVVAAEVRRKQYGQHNMENCKDEVITIATFFLGFKQNHWLYSNICRRSKSAIMNCLLAF
jgi:hypothetical protein